MPTPTVTRSTQRQPQSKTSLRKRLNRLSMGAVLILTSGIVLKSAFPPKRQPLLRTCPLSTPQTLISHKSRVYTTAVDPQGQWMVSGDRAGHVKILDLRTLQTRQIKAHADTVSQLLISNDGTTVISGSWDNRIKLFNLQTGQLVRDFVHKDDVTAIALTPSGNLVSASRDRTLRITDIRTGQQLQVFKQPSPILSMVVNADSKVLFFGRQDGVLGAYSLSTGKKVYHFQAHSRSIRAMALSPDKTRLLTTGADGLIQFWNPFTGQFITAVLNASTINTVAYHPDGHRFISGGQDLRVWDARTHSLICIIRGHGPHWSATVTSDQDGIKLIDGSNDSIKIWQLKL